MELRGEGLQCGVYVAQTQRLHPPAARARARLLDVLCRHLCPERCQASRVSGTFKSVFIRKWPQLGTYQEDDGVSWALPETSKCSPIFLKGTYRPRHSTGIPATSSTTLSLEAAEAPSPEILSSAGTIVANRRLRYKLAPNRCTTQSTYLVS